MNTTYFEFTEKLYLETEKYISNNLATSSEAVSIKKYGFTVDSKQSEQVKRRNLQIHTTYGNGSETYVEEHDYLTQEVLGKMTALWGVERDAAKSGAEYASLILIQLLGLNTDSYLHFTKENNAWVKRFVHQAFEARIEQDDRGDLKDSFIRIDNSQLTDEQYVDLIQAMKRRYGFGKFTFVSLAGITYFTFDPSFQGEPLEKMEKPGYIGHWTSLEPKPIEILKPIRINKGLF